MLLKLKTYQSLHKNRGSILTPLAFITLTLLIWGNTLKWLVDEGSIAYAQTNAQTNTQTSSQQDDTSLITPLDSPTGSVPEKIPPQVPAKSLPPAQPLLVNPQQPNEGQKGYPWQVVGLGVDASSHIRELQRRVPKIFSSEELSEVLDLLSQLYPLTTSIPQFDGTLWTITLQHQAIIDDLIFDTTGDATPPALKSGLDYLVGRIHSSVMTTRLHDYALGLLKKEGYFGAKINIRSSRIKEKVTLHFKINLPPRCLIHSITASFPLPDSSEDILGTPCERRSLEEFIASLGEKISKEGYIEHTLEWGGLNYDHNTGLGTLHINGTPGPLVRYQFTLATSAPRRQQTIAARKSRGELSPQELIAVLRKDIIPPEYSPYVALAQIEELFFEEGYVLAQFDDPAVIKSTMNEKVYEFIIRPSHHVDLDGLRILGARALNREQIIDELKSPSLWPFRRAIKPRYLDERIRSLENLYRDLGYWDIRIPQPQWAYIPSTRKTQLTLRIEEGRLHLFQSLTLTSRRPDQPLPSSREKLTKEWSLSPGDPLSQTQIVELRNHILSQLNQKGFVSARVELKFRREPREGHDHIHVDAVIDPGPRWRIGGIFLFGLNQVHESVVLREVPFQSGEIYSTEKIRQAQSNLAQLGLFHSVRIVPSPQIASDDQNTLVQDLSIIVREAPHGWTSFGPGYDFFHGYNYSIEASYENLFGRGRRLLGRLKVNEARKQNTFENKKILGTHIFTNYTHPYIFNIPWDLVLSAHHRTVPAHFWQYTTTINQSLRYRFSQQDKTSFSLFAKQSLQNEVGSREQLAYILAPGDVRIFSTGASLNWDISDDLIWPRRGRRWDLSYERAIYLLGFNTQFHKVDLTHQYFMPLWKRDVVLALGVRLTTIWDIARNNTAIRNQTLPLSKMLLAGGSSLVRGFARQLGPYVSYHRQSDNPATPDQLTKDIIGGTSRVIIKPKIRFLLSESFAVNLFYDTGNTYLSPTMVARFRERFRTVTVSDSDSTPEIFANHPLELSDLTTPRDLLARLYSATGVSVDYLTPIGNLRLSLAYPLHQPGGLQALRQRGSHEDVCGDTVRECWDRRRDPLPVVHRLNFNLSLAGQF